MRTIESKAGALGFVLAGIVSASGAAAPETLTARLAASPTSYEGKCPAVIAFKGNLYWSALHGRRALVHYTLLRSDEATGPIRIATVEAGRNVPISETWTLGADPTFSGWQQIKAWIDPSRPVLSDRAGFKLTCR